MKKLIGSLLLSVVLFFASVYPFDSFVWSSAEIGGKVIEKAVILIPVQVTGEKKIFYAQLDTGSDATIFYGKLMRKLGLQVDSLNSQMSPFQWYDHELKTAPLEEPLIIDWAMDADIDSSSEEPDNLIIGTVGLDKIIGKILILDFPKQRYAVFEDTTKLTEILPDSVDFIGAVVSYNKFYVSLQLGPDTIPAVRYDCGASSATLILPRDWWQWATGLTGDEPAIIRDSVLSWGNYVNIWNAPAIYDMTFGNIRIKTPTVTYVDWSDPTLTTAKLLGNAPFCDNYVIIVDCIRAKFGICQTLK